MLKLLFAALALFAIVALVLPSSRVGRLMAGIVAALGLTALAACNDKPRVEPTPPVHVEPCRPGEPECTWPDGQPK